MQDNNKLWICLFLLILYGAMVYLKLADSSGLVVLLTYAIKKLLDMHEDGQISTGPKQEVINAPKTISP